MICPTCGEDPCGDHARCKPQSEWTLQDEIDAQETRLKHFCNQVNAGHRQGGGREFLRQIDSAFLNINLTKRYVENSDEK